MTPIHTLEWALTAFGVLVLAFLSLMIVVAAFRTFKEPHPNKSLKKRASNWTYNKDSSR